MGPGTSSDVLVIFYIVIAAILTIVAAGFVLHRRGRLTGRRAGLSFALLSVLPILVGIVWYVWNVP